MLSKFVSPSAQCHVFGISALFLLAILPHEMLHFPHGTESCLLSIRTRGCDVSYGENTCIRYASVRHES